MDGNMSDGHGCNRMEVIKTVTCAEREELGCNSRFFNIVI